jgi:hypothetical protein
MGPPRGLARVIQGYLEVIDQFQARGWAFDPDDPDRYLELEFVLNTQHLGAITADLFRQDLVSVGIGKGDHGFVFNFPTPLDAAELDEVRTHARAADGGRIELPRLLPPEAEPAEEPAPATLLQFAGLASDPSQFPVFVLGSARSGTSAMLQALLKIERYRGYEEGHLLDLVAHWGERLRNFYALKHDETLPGRSTMIEHVPRQYLQDALNNVFVELIRQLFGEGPWVDKTPNSDAIYLAPRFREIWPNARFVFMRRRALENLASRARKFPEYNFAKNSLEWKDAMQAWLAVRDQLQGAAIEVDQMYLSRHPQDVAGQLRGFLDLTEVETRVVAQAFAHDRPQRTASSLDDVLELATIGWADPWIVEFERVCRPLMDEFGYTSDRSYHRDGIDGGGLVVL